MEKIVDLVPILTKKEWYKNRFLSLLATILARTGEEEMVIAGDNLEPLIGENTCDSLNNFHALVKRGIILSNTIVKKGKWIITVRKNKKPIVTCIYPFKVAYLQNEASIQEAQDKLIEILNEKEILICTYRELAIKLQCGRRLLQRILSPLEDKGIISDIESLYSRHYGRIKYERIITLLKKPEEKVKKNKVGRLRQRKVTL